MKKTMLSVALAAVIGLAGFQMVEARPGQGQGPGAGNNPAMSEEDLQARQAFRAETSELRKEIGITRARLQAATNAGDQEAAGQLTEKLFDLREQMQNKAQESGLMDGSAGHGYGMMGGGQGYGGSCPGPGGGSSRGYGHRR